MPTLTELSTSLRAARAACAKLREQLARARAAVAAPDAALDKLNELQEQRRQALAQAFIDGGKVDVAALDREIASATKAGADARLLREAAQAAALKLEPELASAVAEADRLERELLQAALDDESQGFDQALVRYSEQLEELVDRLAEVAARAQTVDGLAARTGTPSARGNLAAMLIDRSVLVADRGELGWEPLPGRHLVGPLAQQKLADRRAELARTIDAVIAG